jgi:RHS repeat-associated protein
MSYHMPYFLGSRPLFTEDFQRLNEKNSLGESGWRTKGERILGSNQLEPVLKHLSIQPAEDKRVTVVKSFNIPLDFPFDISDKNFEIRYNDDMFNDTVASDAYPRHGGHGPSANNIYSSSSTTHSNSTPRISRTSELFNTYYIYTFDGKLLAEYDHNGSCVRDYIYAGNRLIAEYKPQTSEYFYYMTDQINSTRIITNNNGNVVFSEAYGPYGDVQKTWTNTYVPKMKFSGKEREGYSDLDYFGARYFDHKSYRFNSVDPIINRQVALSNPQLWNLYAYCRNNPITYFDPDGRKIEIVGNQEFKRDITIMINYLTDGSKVAEKVIIDLINHKDTIYIKESNKLDMEYDRMNNTININTHAGSEYDNGEIGSPAKGFLHEAGHALRDLNDPAGFAHDSYFEADKQFKYKEERRVITQIENPAAKELGEPIRKNYKGSHVDVKGPISREKRK